MINHLEEGDVVMLTCIICMQGSIKHCIQNLHPHVTHPFWNFLMYHIHSGTSSCITSILELPHVSHPFWNFLMYHIHSGTSSCITSIIKVIHDSDHSRVRILL